jgi:hypothetical protein
VSTEAATCRHRWVRYVLDNSAPSHDQRDGVDAQGRPYRDVPMLPREVFAYAATIGSNFEARTIEAICKDCGANVLDAFRKALS